MKGLPMDVARATFLQQVRHLLAVTVDEPAGEVLLERSPQLRVAVLRELTQAEPAALPGAPRLIQRQDAILR
jgi:hypothetical protein